MDGVTIRPIRMEDAEDLLAIAHLLSVREGTKRDAVLREGRHVDTDLMARIRSRREEDS